ncbi:hypothetical protein M2432_005357 [Mycobacterium sp. OTB74]|nr:hypothetical protein [Mycobacterium sp. OTB74]
MTCRFAASPAKVRRPGGDAAVADVAGGVVDP